MQIELSILAWRNRLNQKTQILGRVRLLNYINQKTIGHFGLDLAWFTAVNKLTQSHIHAIIAVQLRSDNQHLILVFLILK